MSTNDTDSNAEFLFFSYYPLFLVIAGTTLNILTFVTLCRRMFRDTKKQPVMHYMRTMAIFDIVMLYGWNLDHYLYAIHGFRFVEYSIASCKIMSFIDYFITPASAWLRVFICLDRYLALSHLNRTWFSRPKSVLIIIGCIVAVFIIYNAHFLLFACYVRSDGTITANSVFYQVFPLWDYIQLGIYNCVPFVCMVTLDSGVVYHLIRLRRTTAVQNSRIQHRVISITLLITTFLFLIMTIPSGIIFAFFYDTVNTTVLMLVDAAMFTYHILSFPLYFITFHDFRREFLTMIRCARFARVTVPLVNTVPMNIAATTERKIISKTTGHIHTQMNH
ncbi:unnamed protein product [Adineta ricciae]|uniref:G-protein coupled receptors family 1 profile domain-containing protein n=1 Tax=Adineta ricciae TaxID=249248 RepID=A0A815CRF2_ADIRI|nr:unnamed protein product [Adineta ricciae]CAF1287213.1 unnamed protein product [Adineta ricciae]